MRVVIIGLGNQGKKRLGIAGLDVIYTVDPLEERADYRYIWEVPLESFDAALICTPEKFKKEICAYLLENSKHVLCEKPLTVNFLEELETLENLARTKSVFLYVAYNHRFEPALIEAARILESQKLGELYSVRLFYGNGTSQNVKSSEWRDYGSGVIRDLAPHLLDLLTFWNLTPSRNFKLQSAQTFETNSPDHAVLYSLDKIPAIELEVTYCKWKNAFHCDFLAKEGSLHINGLMKWGPVSLQIHKRIFPSGIPDVHESVYPHGDPTWESEYKFFKAAVNRGAVTDLGSEMYIRKQLVSLEQELGEIG